MGSNADKDRMVRVTSGAVEYVTGVVTEKSGQDLTSATFQVGLGTYTDPPSTWTDADDVEFAQEGAVALVSMLVDESVPTINKAHLWVRVTDTPEILPRRCEGGTVTVE